MLFFRGARCLQKFSEDGTGPDPDEIGGKFVVYLPSTSQNH